MNHHQHLEQQLSKHERSRNRLVVAGAALFGALGYSIGLSLARVTEYAEQVEEDEYCHGPEVALHS